MRSSSSSSTTPAEAPPRALAELVVQAHNCTVCAAHLPYPPHPVLRVSSTGLCYPGTVKGSDLPPRPGCAPLWHPPLRAAMPDIHLTLLIGATAQAYYLGKRRGRTLADIVAAWRDFGPDVLPLPHPSPRNRLWFKRHPWFEAEILPLLRERVGAAMAAGDNGGARNPS